MQVKVEFSASLFITFMAVNIKSGMFIRTHVPITHFVLQMSWIVLSKIPSWYRFAFSLRSFIMFPYQNRTRYPSNRHSNVTRKIIQLFLILAMKTVREIKITNTAKMNKDEMYDFFLCFLFLSWIVLISLPWSIRSKLQLSSSSVSMYVKKMLSQIVKSRIYTIFVVNSSFLLQKTYWNFVG